MPIDLFDLTGRVAIVTGASSGIGEHCARVLASAGARVLPVARRRDRLERLAAELGVDEIAAVDLAEPDAAARVVAQATGQLGRVDIVVNAAGITNTMTALSEDPELFARVLTVNLIGPYALAREAAIAMRAQGSGGSIVNISSVLAGLCEPTLPEAGYVASKGGLDALTRELAVQWARHGIRVNALAPGWFPTEMTAGLADDPERGPAFAKVRTPMQRLGRLEELSGPLLLLASDAGSYLTGQTIIVDGGATLI
jgi:NAD(P)-dependent dehydrogenase (short-subunit alcohol dehydrogenase family)